MGKILTTDKLIKSVKRRAAIPTSQVTFEKSDFIDILNEEMDIGFTPFLLSTHEEYLLVSEDLSVVSGQVRIPERAIGNKLVDLYIVDSQGGLTPLTRINIGHIGNYSTDNGESNAYYIMNDTIKLLGTVPANVTLKAYYYLRLSALVADEEGAVVIGLDRESGVIQVSNIPSAFTNTDLYDFTTAKNPNKLMAFDVAVTDVNSILNTITLAPADIPEDLAEGDFVTLAGESIVPQVPVELHSILAQRAAVQCLHAQGDEKVVMAEQKLQQMESKVVDLIDNRVEDDQQIVNNLNSPLRQALRKRRWG